MAYKFQIKSILDLKHKVKIGIFIFVIIALFTSILITHTAFNRYDKTNAKLASSELQSRMTAFISHSEYRMISIASQPDFIHLINADIAQPFTDTETVPQNLYPLMRQIASFISNRQTNSIFDGSEVYNQANKVVLRQGSFKPPYFIVAALCYRDSALSYSANSPCIAKWKLYINQDKLIRLLKLNHFIISDNKSTRSASENLNALFKFKQIRAIKYQLPANIFLHWNKEPDSFKAYTVTSASMLFLFMVMMGLFISYLYTNYILKPIEKLNQHLSDEHSVDSAEYEGMPKEISNFIDAINQKIKHKRIEALECLMHDIKQPLGRLQTLANEMDGPLRQNIMNVYTQIYLSVSKLHSNQYEIVDLNKVIRDCCHTIYPDLVARNKISISSQSHLFTVASYSHLVRVISNVIDNAIKAAEDVNHLEIMINTRGGTVNCICISDNGPGIDAPQIEHVFEEGVSYSNSTGKGLAYCRSTIEKYHGSLTCESSLGHGAKFTIKLPHANTPGNYINSLFYRTNTQLVVIDDESAFYREILSLNLPFSIHYLQTEDDVVKLFDGKDISDFIFMVDYHFHDTVNGIELIEKYHLHSRAYLISTAGDLLKEMNAELSTTLPILSKSDLSNLNFINVESAKQVIVDDDYELLSDIRKIMKSPGGEILFLDNLLQLRMVVPHLGKDVQIALDNRYESECQSGIEFAEKLHMQGFSNISLHSCDDINPKNKPFLNNIYNKGECFYAEFSA